MSMLQVKWFRRKKYSDFESQWRWSNMSPSLEKVLGKAVLLRGEPVVNEIRKWTENLDQQFTY